MFHRHHILGLARTGLAVLLLSPCAIAQRGLKSIDIPEPDPKSQLAQLIPAEGFEINLFAADPMLAKPIQMNWDSAGRLWVASSSIYPHIKPGQSSNDEIVILEDTDRDGVADKRTVFADGLLIPTAVIPGNGGAYVANSTELLLLQDTDADGRADKETVVLSGFGTEDTHHILHTLRWGPGQFLYFNQSIYIHSHIETPWGVRRLGGGGTWQLQPNSLKLNVVMRGCVNPWGRHWNKWGDSFATDGAYGDGICYTFPGSTFATAPGAVDQIRGLNPGQPKMCGLEILSGTHLPEAWRGRMITNDFRGHRTASFVVTPSGSGFASRRTEDLIRSSHRAFRPIDIKMGPDGAVYIADWYNPIIQHGEVDFRDERRDHTHGRIWRVTAKGRPLVQPPQLVGAPIQQLLEALKLPDAWTRTHAKRQLAERDARVVLPRVSRWVTTLDPTDPEYERLRLEALWVHQSLDSVDQTLLRSLLECDDYRVRAAAQRVLSHWHDRIDDSLNYARAGARDQHPRVRLEAICTLTRMGGPDALTACLRSADLPTDTFLVHALRLALLDAPKDTFRTSDSFRQLLFRLQHLQDASSIDPLLDLIESQQRPNQEQHDVTDAILRSGQPKHMKMVFDRILEAVPENPPAHVSMLQVMADTARVRKVVPDFESDQLATLLTHPDPEVRNAAVDLTGAWQHKPLTEELVRLVLDAAQPKDHRVTAVRALAAVDGDNQQRLFQQLTIPNNPLEIRIEALAAIIDRSPETAASLAAQILSDMQGGQDPTALLQQFIAQPLGPDLLQKQLASIRVETDIATQALRAVEESGRPAPQLLNAIRKAGGLGEQAADWSKEQRASFLHRVRTQGDAQRGERIYRRDKLACVRCHAIGGTGGHVGPDLVSIGASAPVDYLVESLLEPNKKIKENFDTVIVVTDSGRVFSGIQTRQTRQHIMLRTAEDKELRIPRKEIESKQNGSTLMPSNLTESLTDRELVDLVRFLSELGKEGRYKIPSTPYIRSWRVATGAPANEEVLRNNSAASGLDLITTPRTALVSGHLPLSEIPILNHADKRVGVAAFRIQVTQPGPVDLRWNSIVGIHLAHDSTPVLGNAGMNMDLPVGEHTFTAIIDSDLRDEDLRIEVLPAPGSPAQLTFFMD